MGVEFRIRPQEELEEFAWRLVAWTDLGRPFLPDVELVGSQTGFKHLVSGEEIEEAWWQATMRCIEEAANPDHLMRDWFIDRLRDQWPQACGGARL